MQNIIPCLWFDGEAEEAAKFYTGVIKNSGIDAITRYGEGAPLPAGTALTISVHIDGLEIILLNGGPEYKLSEAFSLVIHCADQAEVDYYWEALLRGGEAQACGWLKDRFGVSWQIVPTALMDMLQDADPQRVARVTETLLRMVKLDIAELEAAYRQPA